LWSIISTPPNFLWQLQLESWYPSQIPLEQNNKGKKIVGTQLSTSNTIKKFATDQLVGAPINTVLFVAFMGCSKGLTGGALAEYITEVRWRNIGSKSGVADN